MRKNLKMESAQVRQRVFEEGHKDHNEGCGSFPQHSTDRQKFSQGHWNMTREHE